jgi:serine/threonine-protein kinase
MAYEMLTGQVPFRSKTPQALLAAHLTATPAPIPMQRSDVPVALARLIMQCLEKERDKRPQSARELAELLEHPDMVSGAFASAPVPAVRQRRTVILAAGALAVLLLGGWFATRARARAIEAEAARAAAARDSVAAAARARSIVVLPFVNIGRDSSDAYLAEALTNYLINMLGRIPGARVMSRSTAASAREKFATASEVGKALNVGRILEGTVQRDGSRLRVTARVTNTDDGFMVWSDMFERELTDVFTVQDEIARAIADALGEQMGGGDALASSDVRGTDSDAAYDLYLRGRHFFEQRGPLGLRRALDLFQRSARQDRDFARAYAGIAGVYSMLPVYSGTSADSAFGPGFAAATRAIELDSTLAEAFASRAVLLLGRWRWSEAERDYRRAIALDPRYAPAHQWYGEQLMIQWRLPDAVAHLSRAAELDPVSPVIAGSHAMALAFSGRDAEAVAEARRAVDLDSTLFVPRLVLGLTHLLAGRLPASIRELEPALALSGGAPYVHAILGYAYAAGGQRQNAEALAQQLVSRSDADARGAAAIIQLGLGDTSAALSNLEAAARGRAPIFTLHPLGAPMFDPIRSSPRFQAVLRQVGLRRD